MSTTPQADNGTIALIVKEDQGEWKLVEAIADDDEIEVLNQALEQPDLQPLDLVMRHRMKIEEEEEDFGDYVEELLSQPFVKPEIQEHGVQWMKSKLKIEEFKRKETEATEVIATYAMKVFQENPDRRDFWLAGSHAHVLIKVFPLEESRQDEQVA